MKKFSEIEYVRPDMVAEQERIKEYTEALKGVRSYEELRGLFMEEKEREDIWATMAEVAQVRYTVDTRDSFYEGEVQFWNETIPMMHLLIQKAEKVILESPFIKQFAEEFGDFFVKNMEVGQKLADDCIVEDLIEEGNLTQQYSKITANASTKFRGETCNFYGLLKAMQSTDREMRKEAMTAICMKRFPGSWMRCMTRWFRCAIKLRRSWDFLLILSLFISAMEDTITRRRMLRSSVRR